MINETKNNEVTLKCSSNQKQDILDELNETECRNNEEDGYVLVEQTTVLVNMFNSGKSSDGNISPSANIDLKPYTGKWIGSSSSFDNNNERVSNSCKCHAILSLSTSKNVENDEDRSNSQPTFELDFSTFDGSISNMYCKCPCNNCAKDSISKRSDASLLSGLILWNHKQGHIQIKSFQIMLHPLNSSIPQSHAQNQRSDLHQDQMSTKYEEFQASIAFTLFVPFITLSGDKYKSLRKKKCLSPPTQLLLSMLKSDWTNFDSKISFLTNHSIATKERQIQSQPTLFPRMLTLEEIYTRIQPSFHKISISKNISFNTSQNLYGTSLLSLPIDILCCSLAPFLRARSLTALRNSCTLLYTTFQSIVPGLKLTLYPHQITSLDWMRYRERNIITEADAYKFSVLDTENTNVDQPESDVDLHRSITAGSTVLLSRRRMSSKHSRMPDFLRLDTDTGRIEHQSRSNTTSEQGSNRKVARGGMLCDDPGLGKTITVLSLILQTFGLSTREENDGRDNYQQKIITIDEQIFSEHWKSLGFVQTNILSRMVNNMRKEDRMLLFDKLKDPNDEDNDDYYRKIENPICMQYIMKKVARSDYDTDFQNFVADMTLCFQNALSYDAAGSKHHSEASRLLGIFNRLVFQMKKIEVAKTRNAKFSRRDSVSLLNQERAATVKLSSLIPSPSTLLIVPTTLMHHWENQIKLHLDTSYCSKKIPIIYRHSKTRRLREFKNCEDVYDAIARGTHFPFLFIDESSTKALPNPTFLSRFPIVLTATTRMSREWKNGSLEKELGFVSKSRSSPRRFGSYEEFEINEENTACSLLKVHWLRLIIDEGHSMGQSGQVNAIQFASWIYAQRRWVMSGTPTPQTMGKNSLNNILHLVNFLKHDIFSKEAEGDKRWRQYLARPWNKGNLVAFFRLKSLLSFLMVRHTKSHLIILEKPVRKQIRLDLSEKEKMAYNTLVLAAQANIIVTSMEGKISGLQDSLLHPSQSQHAQRALTNILTTCCGGAQIRSMLSDKNRAETMAFLEDVHKVDDIGLRVIQNFLHRASNSEPSYCMVCGMEAQLLLVSPCAHLMCTVCVDNKTKKCLVCDKGFDIDEFQKLQPGFDNRFHWITEEEKLDREREERMREEVDLRGGRPEQALVVHGYPLAPNLNNNINGDTNRRRRRIRRGEDHFCIYPSAFVDGKCTLCHEEHFECNLMNSESKCKTCNRVAEDCPDNETKTRYLIKVLLRLYKEMRNNVDKRRISDTANRLFGGNISSSESRPLKAIIFSQSRLTLNVVGHRLIRRFGGGCVAEYWGKYRTKELEKFHTSDCFCMLMSKDGSHGLDLSFVTTIFFLEEVWDKSLENQVISRAYRMGSKGNVEVIQLIANDSIEELMIAMNDRISHEGNQSNIENLLNTIETEVDQPQLKRKKDSDEVSKRKKLKGEKATQHAKLHHLLTNLKIIQAKYVAKKRVAKKQKQSVRFGESN